MTRERETRLTGQHVIGEDGETVQRGKWEGRCWRGSGKGVLDGREKEECLLEEIDGCEDFLVLAGEHRRTSQTASRSPSRV